MFRLKPYARFIYSSFLGWAKEPTPSEEKSLKGVRIRSSFASTAETFIFLNQASFAQSFDTWLEETPLSYQLKFLNCLSLLEDSAKWAIASIGLEEEESESFPGKNCLVLNLEQLKISEIRETEEDVLSKRFSVTCGLLHGICPANTRLKNSLDRLIWAYLEAVQVTSQSRELSLCDRLQYLKRITSY